MNCSRCGHPLKDHCKGNQSHSHYKDEMKQSGFREMRTHICTSRHCLQPLCSCIDFIEPEVAA